MSKIFIVGSGGAGKSTLADALSERLAVSSYELDEYFWNDGWKISSQKEFLGNVKDIIAKPSWIIDGNYRGPIFDSVYESACIIIWLNLPKTTVMWRCINRSIRMLLLRRKFYDKDCVPSFIGSLKALKFIWSTFDARNQFLAQKVNDFDDLGRESIILKTQNEIDEYLQTT